VASFTFSARAASLNFVLFFRSPPPPPARSRARRRSLFLFPARAPRRLLHPTLTRKTIKSPQRTAPPHSFPKRHRAPRPFLSFSPPPHTTRAGSTPSPLCSPPPRVRLPPGPRPPVRAPPPRARACACNLLRQKRLNPTRRRRRSPRPARHTWATTPPTTPPTPCQARPGAALATSLALIDGRPRGWVGGWGWGVGGGGWGGVCECGFVVVVVVLVGRLVFPARGRRRTAMAAGGGEGERGGRRARGTQPPVCAHLRSSHLHVPKMEAHKQTTRFRLSSL
jgi:hypothetical protein